MAARRFEELGCFSVTTKGTPTFVDREAIRTVLKNAKVIYMEAFEIRIQKIDISEEPDSFLGSSPIVVKYKPPGSRTWQTREAGSEKEQNETMLRRVLDEVLRRAFSPAEKKPVAK